MEQDVILRQSSRRGRNKVGDAPYKGLSRSDWGLRQLDFEEILNDGSTNSLGASIINTDINIANETE